MKKEGIVRQVGYLQRLYRDVQPTEHKNSYSSFVKPLNRELMPNAVACCPEFWTRVEGF
jgi:hypothetical protein